MFTQSTHDYVGYIIVLIDVTREIEMDEMKSQFISNVSPSLLLSPIHHADQYPANIH